MSEKPLRVVAAVPLPPKLLQGAFQDRVEIVQAQTDEELRREVRDADILYSWKVPEIVPTETPRLRWIQLPSAGADHIRNLPVWKSNVAITASQGLHTVPMSEHALALLLALTRRIPELTRAQDRHEWTQHGFAPLMGELRGKTMGIIGWGKIGDGIAHLAQAFGMRVIGTRWSVMVAREAPTESREYADPPWLEPTDLPTNVVYPTAQTHDVLAESDVVVLILPLTDQTRGSFGEPEFRATRRGALFINIGRGKVVDEDAMIRALKSGGLAGAALDVFAQEPLPRSSPLWTMPNVIISPHVGGISENTRERGAWFFAVNLTRYLEGQELLNLVKRDQGY